MSAGRVVVQATKRAYDNARVRVVCDGEGLVVDITNDEGATIYYCTVVGGRLNLIRAVGHERHSLMEDLQDGIL